MPQGLEADKTGFDLQDVISKLFHKVMIIAAGLGSKREDRHRLVQYIVLKRFILL